MDNAPGASLFDAYCKSLDAWSSLGQCLHVPLSIPFQKSMGKCIITILKPQKSTRKSCFHVLKNRRKTKSFKEGTCPEKSRTQPKSRKRVQGGKAPWFKILGEKPYTNQPKEKAPELAFRNCRSHVAPWRLWRWRTADGGLRSKFKVPMEDCWWRNVDERLRPKFELQ